MSKNSTFVDMAIHAGIPFGSAGGAAPELREERLQRHLWADGCRPSVSPAGLDGSLRPFSVRSRGQGRGSAAIFGGFSFLLRTVMWYYRA
jgi:hypothetical protein